MNDTMDEVLRRYLRIQEEEQRLKEEKSALQERLAAFLASQGESLWYPEVDGQKLKVRCQTATVVEYDEPVLQQRLGERYAAILGPDWRKIRRHLGDLEAVLLPHLGLVGSPQADRVRGAIEQGVVRREEFAGAFKKTIRRTVAVARAKPDGAAEGSPPAEP
jgi:hypothetical protein